MNKFRKILVKRAIRRWILAMDQAERLPTDIVALNFGLFEPFGIELIGSKTYDAENEDWACEEDFVPRQRTCPNLSIPARLGWEAVLQGIAEILKELTHELTDVKLLRAKHITTGFCDGNLMVVK